MAGATGEQAFRRQLAAQQTRVDERPGLAAWARLRRPTLVVAAAQDALCPVDLHEEIAGLVPGSELAVVGDSGHLSPLEQPGRITHLVTAWLGNTATATPRIPRLAAEETTCRSRS